MDIVRSIIWLLLVNVAAAAGSAVLGQSYPNKPIRMLTAEPGGSADFVTRLIAQGLSAGVGQQVVVDNRGAAGGIMAAQTVAKAAPDGYTLLCYGNQIWIAPLLRQRGTYDPVKDFSPITLPVSSPLVVVVHPSVQVTSIQELIDMAKSRPGALNYGSAGAGAATHLAAELFKALAGVNITQVPYKGAGPALNALIGGQLQVMFATAGGVAPHVKSGRLRAVAVTSAEPSALVPGLPTVAASLPGYEAVSTYGVFAPAGTPAALVNRLNQEIVRALNTPDMKEKFFAVGVGVVGSSPQQFAAAMKSEIARMGKVIKDAGIKED